MQIAVDIGGTFTDVVLVHSGQSVSTRKLLSTPPDYGRAVIAGIRGALADAGGSAEGVTAVLHGMTIATNAVLESRGSTPGIVTTTGFRDVLEFTRGRRPVLYDPLWRRPPPLSPRRYRFEIDHRIASDGNVLTPVQPRALDDLAERIRESGVASLAVCLINSYLAPAEERAIASALTARCPGVMITASVDLSLELGEYERTSTAVVNAYVQPVVDAYLRQLEHDLAAFGINSPFYVMQSSGGLLRSQTARAKPVHLIESGPAAGVIATRMLVQHLGIGNAIAFDMGGTTAKASLIEDGEPFEAADYEVGAGMNVARGMHLGAGYVVRVSSLDIAEVGAGGGSIFWLDRGGAARVGPHSSGAVPGPACYGLGGNKPTLSDAAVVLGYFNPEAIAGGVQPIDLELAQASLRPIAEAMNLPVPDAAHGAYRIAISNMTRLLRAVTSERGRDPRDFTLVAFGGSGPAYAAELAAELGLSTVLIPVSPGLFSAVGLLASDPQHDDVRTYDGIGVNLREISARFLEMEREMVTGLTADGYSENEITVYRFLDMRYAGQKGTLKVPVPPGDLVEPHLDVLLGRHDDEHYRTFGHRKVRSTAEVAALRIRALCRRPGADPFDALARAPRRVGVAKQRRDRQAYFGPALGIHTTPVLERGDLDSRFRPGPIIVEEMDATIVVPPTASARLDELGNVVIRIASPSLAAA